jgi:hypothetical protein
MRPDGELYPASAGLLDSHPDTPADELLALLVAHETGQAQAPERLSPEQDLAWSMTLANLHSRGLAAAREYSEQHPLADWLKVMLTEYTSAESRSTIRRPGVA